MADKLPAKRTPAKKTAGPRKYASTRPANVTNVTEVNKSSGKPAGKPSNVKSAVKKDVKNIGKAPKVVTGSFYNKFAPRQRPSKSVVTYRHVIAAEFWIGLIVILSTNTGGEIVEAAAFIALMAILFAVSAGGAGAGRISAAFGGLVVLTLMVKNTGKAGARFSAIQDESGQPGEQSPTSGAGGPPRMSQT